MTVKMPKRNARRVKTQRVKRGSTVWTPPKEIKRIQRDEEARKPRITVIIPCANQYSKVALAYNSVFPQLGKYDQLIIADQGSVDGTNIGMFAEDSRIIYLRYPKTKPPEIINFALLNVVQTKYVLLLDARSVITKNFMDGLISELTRKKFIVCKNTGRDVRNKPQTINYLNSYTGYAFLKNDAIKAGLFDIVNLGLSSALFVEKMKDMGCKPTYMEDLNITTMFQKMGKGEFNQDGLDEALKKGKYTDYSNLKLGLEPVTFIVIDKQKNHLNQLLNQLTLPGDEIKRLNAINPNTLLDKFNDAMINAKNSNIIVVKCDTNDLLTYDPITNLRVNFDKRRLVQTNMEDGVNCIAFHKDIYDAKPKEEMTIDDMIKFLAKGRGIDLVDIIEHHKRKTTEKIMKGGQLIEEDVKPEIEAMRRKKGHTSVWLPKGRGKKGKRLKSVKKKGPSPVSRVGIPHYSMKWKHVSQLPKIPGIQNRKPKILLISDVKGWAWHYKSQQLQKYLGDDFKIDICWLLGPRAGHIKPKAYDLYVTFGYSYVGHLKAVTPRKKVTGITAHRPHSVLVPAMRKAAVVHANSAMLYEELQTMHNIVYYVPNGVDEKLFTPMVEIPEERDNIVVGHVGKLSAMKGQDKYIKPAVERAGAIGKYHFNDFTNALPMEQMPNVYKGMDVFIVASKEDGTPNPALEAAACGIPIISNRIGNMPEFIEDGVNGFLVEKHIGAYVEKIKWLRKNRDKLIEMGHNARKTVEEGWTWAIQAENYRTMFKEVLGI